MAAAEFRAFQDYFTARASAEKKLGKETPVVSKAGPLTLLGAESDKGLLERLAQVALQTQGAGLTSISNCSLSAAASCAASVVAVVACGAGDTSNGVPSSGPVVYVRSAGAARQQWARDVSSHDFEALEGSEEEVKSDFERLVRILRCGPAECLGSGTYFVSLTYSDVTQAMSTGKDWEAPKWLKSDKGDGKHLHDGLEVRADLLKQQDEDFVLSQLALVRRQSQGLPIIYTVRSKIQGGAFPDDEEGAWKLTMIGLRFGVEYVDVEAGWSREGRNAFLSMAKRCHPGLRVIGSYHDIQRPLSAINDHDLCSLFTECAYGPEGSVDIVKVVGRADSAQCSIRVNQCAQEVRPTLPASVRSVIAICTTEAGRLSRALNVMLGPTPVAHPSLPGLAAPGQLSAVEIEQIRQTLGLPVNPFREPQIEEEGTEAAKKRLKTA